VPLVNIGVHGRFATRVGGHVLDVVISGFNYRAVRFSDAFHHWRVVGIKVG
jgi:hypothetical protein